MARLSDANVRSDVVGQVDRLRRANQKTGLASLRKISAALAEAGHLSERGRPFNQRSIKVMVDG
jgi:hypothetical protein